MAFPLKNLELHVDDYRLPVGEKWYEEGKVKSLYEADKNLWVAEVSGYEVEVQISPSKVIGTTCECPTYRTAGECEHIIATMLAVRKAVEEKKQKRTTKRKTKINPSKFTTAVLLQQVNSDDLGAFVREYARTNRAFAIALKARFASDVALTDNKEKYIQLLETTLSAARKRNRMISHRGVNNVLKVLDELLVQSEDAMAQNYYTDALMIAQAIIEKISPILNKAESNASALSERVDTAFNLVDQVIASQPAPSLLQEIWEYTLQECGRLPYWIAGVADRFFKTLLQQATETEQQTALIDKLDNLLDNLTKFGDYRTTLILTKLSVYEKAEKTKEAQQLIVDNLSEPDILEFAVQQALNKENYPRAKYLAEEGMRLFSKLNVRHFLEDALLQVADYQKDTEKVVHYARQRFLVSLNLEYYKKLKEYYTGDWQTYRNELLTSLQRMPYSIRKRDAIANVYALEEDYATLLEYIVSIRSLDLLKTYDQQLIPTRKKEVYQHYEDFLKSFLRHHLGRQTSQKVRKTIQHLYEIGARDLADRLVDQFRLMYRERHTLIDELIMF
ncbi:MAG: SWIM zinc finger domain-containing protein [Saprospiraceae bacterium]